MGLSGVIFGMIQPSRDMLVRKAAPPGAAAACSASSRPASTSAASSGRLLFGWLMDHGSPRSVFCGAVVFMAATALYGLLEDARRQRPLSSASGEL